jgi:hypothetical protein
MIRVDPRIDALVRLQLRARRTQFDRDDRRRRPLKESEIRGHAVGSYLR